MQPTDNKYDNHICRAKIAPSKEGEDYDFECVAVPVDNGQLNYSFQNEEYFNQVLRTGAENIDTSRLDNGIPLFDNHPWDNSASNTLGITVGYVFEERGLVCRCKFGARADEALRSDVKNGVVNTVSIEGRVQRYSIERNIGQIPVYYAEMWTPESLSLAPVPNDIGAKIEVKRALEAQLKINNQPKEDGLTLLINKF